MTEQERYQRVDLPFYRAEIRPVLPRGVLDFHAHVGDNGYRAMRFGMPTPQADIELTNRCLAEAAGTGWLHPLMLAGKGLASPAELEQALATPAFKGYKVLLNWFGDDYGQRTIEDMLSPVEMEPAEPLGLIVLLHAPRAGRLADTVIQEGVRALAQGYPRAQVVLAHCGRCAYRVITPDIRASFMAYEIVPAIRRAAERAGIATGEMEAIFHDNGARLLARVEA